MLEKTIFSIALIAIAISLYLLDVHYFTRKRGTEATKATHMAATAYRYNEWSEIIYRHLHALVLLSMPYLIALMLYLCYKAGMVRLHTNNVVLILIIAPVTLAGLYLHMKHTFAYSTTLSTRYDDESFLERLALPYVIDRIILPTYIRMLYAVFAIMASLYLIFVATGFIQISS